MPQMRRQIAQGRRELEKPRPYGVPGATPTHVEGVASPKASPKPSPRDEAASLPSSDEEAAVPADKRAAETGDEPPAKKSRLHKEIRGLVKVVKDVVIGLTASTSTLDSTNESLQQGQEGNRCSLHSVRSGPSVRQVLPSIDATALDVHEQYQLAGDWEQIPSQSNAERALS